MAYLFPIITNRRNCRRSGPGAVIAGVILFLVFGIIFFLFFNRSGVFGFNFSIIFWIGGFMIFGAIVLAASAVAMSKPHNKPRSGDNTEQQNNSKKQTLPINPYKVPTLEKKVKEVPDSEIPVNEIINYCRYCGAKKDLNAVFCHMCGSKFE